MKTRKIFLTGILMSLLSWSNAAEPDSIAANQDTVIPYQLTFISPLGTNGMASYKYTNNVSMNIIAGYNGGVEGIEIGGFSNLIDQNVAGSQIAGFTNIVKGDLEGVQIAGFTNVIRGKTDGVMIAGFNNHAHGSLEGVQIAGFSNQSMQHTEGMQIAGFGNFAQDDLKGIQLAGFGNFSGDRSEVSQLAGFINVQHSGKSYAQLAGFANCADTIEGAQISGFINQANHVRGLQLSFINLADTFERGIPVGFYCHVNAGYRVGLVQINELGWIEGQYRTGVDLFHNVFSVALSPLPGRSGWALGYGVGSQLWQRQRHSISAELVMYHVNEGELWTNAINSLIRFSGRYTYHPGTGRFGITAGPSINLLTTSKTDVYGDSYQSNLAPYSILEEDGTYLNSKLWVGGQVGIVF